MKYISLILIFVYFAACKNDTESSIACPYKSKIGAKLASAFTIAQKKGIDSLICKQAHNDTLLLVDLEKKVIDSLQIIVISTLKNNEMYGYKYSSNINALIMPDSNDYLMQLEDDIADIDSVKSFLEYIHKHGLSHKLPLIFDEFYLQNGYKCHHLTKSFLLTLGFSDSIATKYAASDKTEVWAYRNDFHGFTIHITWAGTPPLLLFNCYYTTILYDRLNKTYEVIVSQVSGREGDSGHWQSLFSSLPKPCKCE